MNLLPRFETTIFFPNPNPVTQPRGQVRSHYFRPKQPIKHQTAGDRVIEFGKYKGRMMGTLPSNYLRWVSKNLRAREMEEWAKLADQVLEDPVYKDRIEWEFAQDVLSGNGSKALSSSAVDELMDISERFGWDNQDKKGWANIKFELLGTSKGGRIPRLEKSREEGHSHYSRADHDALGKEKQLLSGVGERRKERRERQKKKKIRGSFVNVSGILEDDSNDNGVLYNNQSYYGDERPIMKPNENNGNGNPFPGREALFRKVFNRR